MKITTRAKRHLDSIATYNWQTFKSSPLSELSGALGDLGTLLPLMIALALGGSIDLSSTLVVTGITNIVTGAIYGVPLPVQPMKAIAAVTISQSLTKSETAAAGLTVAAAVLFLAITGLLHWLNRVVPVPVVKGIQVGAGLSLAISAGSTLIKPLGWASPSWDNRIWAIAAFAFLVVADLYKRLPYALIVFVFGLIVTVIITPLSPSNDTTFAPGLWHPHAFFPSASAWRRGAIDAAIPQLPLTTLNSILAVVSLCESLFPPGFPPTPSTTSIGLSVATANLVGCWFGAMPLCHGSGGLAGQYRFGARSGASVIVLGTVKLLLGLFVGDGIVPLLQRFPKSLLGVMVLAAGVELAKVGQSVAERRPATTTITTIAVSSAVRLDESATTSEERDAATAASTFPSARRAEHEVPDDGDAWMVMMITAAGCLAFKNDAIGFIAGLVWHWGVRAPELLMLRSRRRKAIRLDDTHEYEGEERRLIDS